MISRLRVLGAWLVRACGRLRLLTRLMRAEQFLARMHPCAGCGVFVDITAIAVKRAYLVEEGETKYVMCLWCKSRMDGTAIRQIRTFKRGKGAA